MIEGVCVSSGFGLSKEQVKGSLAWWKKRGVELHSLRDSSYKKDLLCASDLNSRLKELKKAFSKSSSGNLVWALRGGYGMQELLPFLKASDFKSQKIYMGFSDCTSLHYYLNKNLGIPSVHGPHANAAFQKFSPDKINNKISNLLNNPKEYSDVFKSLKLLNEVSKKQVLAPMVGGNLTTLVSILGTKFDKGASGDILFLEEVQEPAYKVNRLLTHLEQSGFLKGAKAVVFGHVSHSDQAEEKLIKKILKRWALKQKSPVLSGMQAGHVHKNNKPFWLGKKSKLLLDESPCLHNNV